MEGRVMGIYIKGFKPKDGLYVIKDRVIRKYKGNGGTVRPYELVEVKEPHGRLIDADELKQAEKRISSLPWGDGRGNKVKFTWMPHEVQRLIDNSPTIDAVEVVRCRDCKNRAKYAVCDFLGEDGFCSHGERREDGEA